ncbi:MAG: SDR family NAD(P)-dependent oxidoreductase [Pseudobdellovibrionaceae bacterium]
MKTILVTGSTDGIGLATASQLVQRGHRVLIHGRNQEKAKLATSKVMTAGSGQALPVWGDLSMMSEVVELANQVKKVGPELDILINNAGVYMNQKKLSKDGFEMTFCVNHLAVHLLTHELLPLLKTRPRARIVTVSSIAHQKGHLDFDNLNGQKHFDGYEAYSVSKLCNVLFTRALAAILKNSPITANCLHPGVIDTKLLHAGFQIQGDTTEKGSEGSIFLALDPTVESTTGGYFVNNKLTYPSRLAQDDNLTVQLWKKSEELLRPWLS